VLTYWKYIENLKDMVFERLCVYNEKSRDKRSWPEHILFYRDGVSESQYGMVKTMELGQINEAVNRVRKFSNNEKYDPKITFLVVGKRHHMRFYPKGSPDDAKSLVAGHVMDTEVVIPHIFNFYLQSHDSALGTAKPAHYVVLVDGSEYGATGLQDVVSICYHVR
jgi:eukaryotic translation initiation factor 2C